jgi:MATE family multidrug resistance protein
MSTVTPDSRLSRIPAVRFDAHGRRHVDLRAVVALAAPLMLNSAVQLVLNLTDTWFVGHISTDAMAAMGATNFLAIVCLLAIGGVGLCVQTLVAQAYGARSSVRASRGVWLGLWAALLTTPVFVAVALAGPWLFALFGLAPMVEAAAIDYWMPRLVGGPLSVALWAISGFFNGIGRTRVTFFVMLLVGVLNAILNEVLIFRFGLGIAGSAWATTLSVGAGTTLAAVLFLSAPMQRPYRTRLTWRPSAKGLRRVFALGIPTGMFPAVDLVAISLFQIMQVRLGAIEGAATQIVMMLTSLAYMPAIGIAMAGTTLVGQSIGAGDKAWAARMGNTTILLVTLYMGAVGIAIGLGGPWLVPLFIDPADPHARDVIALGLTLVWIGGAYQLFDGVNLASAFCLRGAGDVKVPTRYLMLLAWGAFVPLAHMFSFARGEGWVEFLPQFGWGSAGGWTAALLYIVALGVMMGMRWNSGAWQRIKLT